MNRRGVSAFGLCVVFAAATAPTAAAAQDSAPIRLLPTEREAARVRVLENDFDNHLTDDVRRDYAELKAIVQDFVIRQLDAAPGISDGALYDQLRKVIGRTWSESPDGGLFVKSGWADSSRLRVWAVAYAIWLGSHTEEGVGVVIDSYVWQPGATRLAGRQDSYFSGYSLHVDWLASGLYSVGFLAEGRRSGSNGLGLWRAAVYFCDQNGVKRIWESADLHGLTAVGDGQLIALRHAQPCVGMASNACAWTYEVYELDDWGGDRPTISRVLRETRDVRGR